jgi:MYND finger
VHLFGLSHAMSTRCCVCNATPAKGCSKCRSANYCSTKCQRDDWRAHKLLCEAFALLSTFDTKQRPTAGAVLALYFPILPYGQKGLPSPQMIWINPDNMNMIELNSDGTLKYTECLRYDHTEETDATDEVVEGRNYLINANHRKGFSIDYPVVIYMREKFNSRPNLSLVETTQGDMGNRWSGPLVIHSRRSFHGSQCQDVTLSDFRTFLDFCKVYSFGGLGGLGESLRTNAYLEVELTDPPLFASMLDRHSSRIFKGVEIACEGDSLFLDAEQFVAVDVPAAHPIFEYADQPAALSNPNNPIVSAGGTDISKMIELPLMIRRIFPDKQWHNPGLFPESVYRNSVAEYLNLNTDVKTPKWGFHDLGRSGSGQIYGRVLVIREDKLPLTVRQVEVLVAYFKKVFHTLGREKLVRCRGLLGGRLHEERAKLMAEHVSRAKFEAFWKEFKEQKIHEGNEALFEWKDETSPYEVIAEGRDDNDDLGHALDSLALDSDQE